MFFEIVLKNILWKLITWLFFFVSWKSFIVFWKFIFFVFHVCFFKRTKYIFLNILFFYFLKWKINLKNNGQTSPKCFLSWSIKAYKINWFRFFFCYHIYLFICLTCLVKTFFLKLDRKKYNKIVALNFKWQIENSNDTCKNSRLLNFIYLKGIIWKWTFNCKLPANKLRKKNTLEI